MFRRVKRAPSDAILSNTKPHQDVRRLSKAPLKSSPRVLKASRYSLIHYDESVRVSDGLGNFKTSQY